MRDLPPPLSDAEILSARPARNTVDPRRPYAFLTEPEPDETGTLVDVATLFLTNRECPYRCLVCDLWKNTLTQPVRRGDIPEQIRWGLLQIPPGRHVKLYNSGNFFDRKAIPREDFPEIADLVRGFDRVIVENHPNLCDDACLLFRDLIAPASLEIALGLETCHPEVLPRLNKRMTLDDYERASTFLVREGIAVRTFLLLKPPYLDETEGVAWTLRSLEYAFEHGSGCCAIIPTRAGNGMMERLEEDHHFRPPQGSSLEEVMQRGLELDRGRVLVDLWDAERFFPCPTCGERRIARLQRMNLEQTVPAPPPNCPDCDP